MRVVSIPPTDPKIDAWWASIVDKVSYPSTKATKMYDPEVQNVMQKGDLSYDGYPFLEWEDLDDDQKAIYGTKKVRDALAGQARPHVAADAVRQVQATIVRAWTIQEARNCIEDAIRHALREEEVTKKGRPHPYPASPEHLMAEGHMLMRARNHITGVNKCYERTVTFDEPVSKFTCLKGDNLAVGGDMLTGCTVTDTVPEAVIKHVAGKRVIVHRAKAIST